MNLNYGAWIGNRTNKTSECALMILKNGQWNDEDCRKKHGFICQSEKRADEIIQFRYNEFVALKNESFVEIKIDRLFVSWTETTLEWEVINQTADYGQEIMECNGTISFKSGESTTKLGNGFSM